MHTSNDICLNDVSIFQTLNNTQITFTELFPNYHTRDRIAIVTRSPIEGIIGAGRIISAFTAAFYKSLRKTGKPFFNYPQHFAIFTGIEPKEENTAPWSMLDVWPDSQWIYCEKNLEAILQTVFKLQINRLIWPSNWIPKTSVESLSETTRKILVNRIDEVLFYNSEEPEIILSSTGSINRIILNAATRIGDDMPKIPQKEQLKIFTTEQFFSFLNLEIPKY